MPNWFHNTIHMSGNRNKIRPLLKKNDEGYIPLLHIMRPPPNECDWDWYTDNWGTKWDISDFCEEEEIDDGQDDDEQEEYDDYYIRFSCDTPWGPPIEALEYYSEENPDVKIALYGYEEGLETFGLWCSGKEYVEYSHSSVDRGAVLSSLLGMMNNLPKTVEGG